MAENKYNLYEMQKKIHYNTVAPILTAWNEQSDNDVTDLARMAYESGRNSISKEKNKMKAVAQLFGKQLGEDFVIQDAFRYRVMAKFSKEGMLVYHDLAREWLNNPHWLFELLTGEAVIVND